MMASLCSVKSYLSIRNTPKPDDRCGMKVVPSNGSCDWFVCLAHVRCAMGSITRSLVKDGNTAREEYLSV